MAQKSYSKSELSKVASQAKRQIINKIRKGTFIKITKTEAYDIVARMLKLKSSRTLWIGETNDYLSGWFTKLENEIQDLLNNTKTDNIPLINSGFSNDIDIDKIAIQLNEKNLLIGALEESNKILRKENEELRLLIIEKHGKIDI